MRLPLQIVPVGALFVACTTVRPVQPAELSPPHAPTRVWVTGANHSTVVLDSARVSGDSLVGSVNGQAQRLVLSEATVLRAREPSEARTAALVFFGVSGAFVLVAHFVDKSPAPYCAENLCAVCNCC